MYEAFFGLIDRPFAAIPEVDRFFPGVSIEAARKNLARCIERGEGPGLVMGPPGTGKTLLLQVLAKQFSARYQTVTLTAGHVGGRRGLLQSILHALRQPYRGLEDGELRLALVGHLIATRNDCAGVLLLVDEAHALSTRLLEELRMLTNVTSAGDACLRLVLAGGAGLEELFANPKLEVFSQRVAARCYLNAFERSETAAYVRRRLSDCGAPSQGVFDSEAADVVFRLTDGIPRLVNQVCDHALILAYVAGSRVVDAATIEEAWADLQQLPAPWTPAVNERRTGAAQDEQHVVEFGSLDAAEDAPDAIPFHGRRASTTIDKAEARLEHSEELLGQLDEDFRPAGSIGPEAEIVIVAESHPFDELFAEEELVVDRYASLDTNLFAGCPIVSSIESQELGVSLAAAARAAEPPTPDAWSHEQRTSASSAANSAVPYTTSLEIGAGETLRAFSPESSVQPIEQADSAAPRSTGGNAVGRAYSLAASANRQAGASPATDEPDDSDLIVLEDDEPTTPTIRAIQPARRQEYRQLFAKLRRG
jgi:type II secretory pathway predicted ATPase ExeA